MTIKNPYYRTPIKKQAFITPNYSSSYNPYKDRSNGDSLSKVKKK